MWLHYLTKPRVRRSIDSQKGERDTPPPAILKVMASSSFSWIRELSEAFRPVDDDSVSRMIQQRVSAIITFLAIRRKISILATRLDSLDSDLSKFQTMTIHGETMIMFLSRLESVVGSWISNRRDGSLLMDLAVNPSLSTSSNDPQRASSLGGSSEAEDRSRWRNQSKISASPSDSWAKDLDEACGLANDISALMSSLPPSGPNTQWPTIEKSPQGPDQRKIPIPGTRSNSSNYHLSKGKQPVEIHGEIRTTFLSILKSLNRRDGSPRTDLNTYLTPSTSTSNNPQVIGQSRLRTHPELSEANIDDPLAVSCPNCLVKRPTIAEPHTVPEEDYNAKRKKVSMAEPKRDVPKEPVFGCPVCTLPLVSACSTVCGHIFCEACIKTSIRLQKRCPSCRHKLTMRSFRKVYLPASINE